jgi:hypothetical protein
MALVFSPLEQGGRYEVMEVYASGFAGHQGGYFISGKVFPPNAKGFH